MARSVRSSRLRANKAQRRLDYMNRFNENLEEARRELFDANIAAQRQAKAEAGIVSPVDQIDPSKIDLETYEIPPKISKKERRHAHGKVLHKAKLERKAERRSGAFREERAKLSIIVKDVGTN